MTGFDEATRALRVDETTYDVCLDGDYAINGALNGGYLMAVITRGVVDASPHDHPVATSAQFLRTARPGPARVVLEQVKTGRTATVTRATLVQEGVAQIDTLITTATLTGRAPDWSPPPPPMPPLEECHPLPRPKPESNTPFGTRVDTRFDPRVVGWLENRPSGRPESRAYLRMAEPKDPDPFVLAVAVDALPPVVFSTGHRGWAPTVELTWYLRALPAPGWLSVHARGRLIGDGWFDEETEVWDSAGRLVAQSRQLALLGRA